MQSLSYQDDSDLHGNEHARETHFHINVFTLRLLLTQAKGKSEWPNCSVSGVFSILTPMLFFCRREDILAPESGHGRKVFALKFHPFDDNIFLTGGWDRCVKVQINVPLVKP